MSDTAREAWLKLLISLKQYGTEARPRDMTTRELLGFQTKVDMSHPVMNATGRSLGYKFMAAEAAWILSGDNRVATIAPYSRIIHKFSDDGIRFAGAYGPKVVDQLSYVVDKLDADQWSRQAVMTIWRENPRLSKDIPCTISHQFLLRPCLGPQWQLELVTTMRSSDAWLGWPYDTFNGAMTAAAVMIELRRRGHSVQLGTHFLTMGSSHLYKRDWDLADDVRKASGAAFSYLPFNVIDNFDTVDELISNLWGIAGRCGQGQISGPWLEELQGN